MTPKENLKKKKSMCKVNIHKVLCRFKTIACSNFPCNTLPATGKISLQSTVSICTHLSTDLYNLPRIIILSSECVFQNNSQISILKDRKAGAKVTGKKKYQLKNRFCCFAQAVAKCTESGSKSPRNMSNQAI